jgi:hypothetical protein
VPWKSAILQVVDHALVVVTGFAKLLDVFIGDVLRTLSGLLEELKTCCLCVFELSFAPLLLALEVFDEVHHVFVLACVGVVAFSHMTPPDARQLFQTPVQRFARQDYQREENRRRELIEQRSDANAPDVRIRAWERLHGLRLPGDPAHRILDMIAVSTRLTLDQVREEQAERAARRQTLPRL